MPAVGQDVQINAIGRLFGQQTVTTFFYKLDVDSGVLESADPNDIAQEWGNGMGAAMIDCISSDWELVNVEVRDPRTPPGWASGDAPQSQFGVLAGGSLPPTVAQVITRRSAQAGRRYRGRVFLPGVPTGAHDDGELTGAHLLLLQAFADDMVTTIPLTATAPGLILRPVIWSKVNQSSVEMTSAVARLILRSQRRREIGVGK